MKGKDLFEAMGKIDDRYVSEAAPDEKTLLREQDGPVKTVSMRKKRKWYQNPGVLGGLATAAAVILLAGIVLPNTGLIRKMNSKDSPGASSEKFINGGVEVDQRNAEELQRNAEEITYAEAISDKEKYSGEAVPRSPEGEDSPDSGEESGNWYDRFPLLINGGSGNGNISQIACFVALKKEDPSPNVSFISTQGVVYRETSDDVLEHTLSGFLKTTVSSSKNLAEPNNYHAKNYLSSIDRSELNRKYYVYEQYSAGELRTEDLTLGQFLPEGEDEVILVILGCKEDSVTYLVKKGSDPESKELFDWYHECEQKSP